MQKRKVYIALFTIICLIVSILVIGFDSITGNTKTIKSLERFRDMASYEFYIPEIIYSEPNIETKEMIGNLLEIENEHIKYRVSDNIPENADICGIYDQMEIESYILDKSNNTVYRLRGNSNKIHYVTWEFNGIKYGINYKPGLDFNLALEYIGIDTSNIAIQTDKKE